MTAPKKNDIIYPELSYKIMGAAYEVHNGLGPGFLESIYQQAMMYELKQVGLAYEYERLVSVAYKGVTLGIHRLDLVVEGKIILELKAVAALNDIFKQQVMSYLKATNLRLGILINFGGKSVESVRILNKAAPLSP